MYKHKYSFFIQMVGYYTFFQVVLYLRDEFTESLLIFITAWYSIIRIYPGLFNVAPTKEHLRFLPICYQKKKKS